MSLDLLHQKYIFNEDDDLIYDDMRFCLYYTIREKKSRNEYILKTMRNRDSIKHNDRTVKEEFENEISFLKVFKITNIINLIEYNCDKKEQFFYIIYEKTDRDLQKLLETEYKNGMSSKMIRKIFFQLISALKIMVKHGKCHRDLKPLNILFSYNDKKSDFIIKLTGFYFVTDLNENEEEAENCGTPIFKAPEVENGYYSNKCDLYNLGIILYMLKTGEYIFEGKNFFEIFNNKRKNIIKKDTDDPLLNDLIKKLVVVEPRDRIDWIEYFEHPFFKVNDDKIEIKNYKNLKLLGKYKYEEKIIGKGGFGRVFKGIDEKNNPIAIKQIDLLDDKRQETIEEIKKEINIMKIMQKDNKYSIKYIDSIEQNCYYYIIMEYCDISLEKKIIEEKGLKLNIIQIIMRQLNKNLQKLNERSLIHKDIKPDNILIKYKNGNKNIFEIKLIDYGLSKELSKKYDYEIAGDKNYMAPESKINKINIKSDLWSIGIMMYKMYFNQFPFENNKLYIKKSGNIEFDDLISKLLVIDHHKRIEWKDYYEHDFFYEMY